MFRHSGGQQACSEAGGTSPPRKVRPVHDVRGALEPPFKPPLQAISSRRTLTRHLVPGDGDVCVLATAPHGC